MAKRSQPPVPNKVYSNQKEMISVMHANNNYHTYSVPDIREIQQYELTIISNKKLPFKLNVNINDKISEIKKRINNIHNDIDIQLQTLLCRNYPNPVLQRCAHFQKLSSLWAPRVLALRVETWINFTIKYQYSSKKCITKTFKKFATDTFVDKIIQITDNKCILTSLICKHDDKEQRNMIIIGFIRRLNINFNIKYLIELIMAYYFIEKNVINIFGYTLQDANIKNNGTIILYKDMNKKYIQYDDLNNDDTFNVTVIAIFTGRKWVFTVDRNSTGEDIKTMLQDKEGIPAEQSRLIYNGRYVQDLEKLIDQHIGPNTNIFWRMRWRGS